MQWGEVGEEGEEGEENAVAELGCHKTSPAALLLHVKEIC